ncbi:MAG: hypothetical protein ACI91R_002309 [Vicingaceae bacterium]|jgi:hypothetical protein
MNFTAVASHKLNSACLVIAFGKICNSDIDLIRNKVVSLHPTKRKSYEDLKFF